MGGGSGLELNRQAGVYMRVFMVYVYVSLILCAYESKIHVYVGYDVWK